MAVDRRRKDPGEVVVGSVGAFGFERTSCPGFTTFLPPLNKQLFVFPCVVRCPDLEVFSLCCYFSRNITLERLKKKNTLLTCQEL